MKRYMFLISAFANGAAAIFWIERLTHSYSAPTPVFAAVCMTFSVVSAAGAYASYAASK